MAASSSKPRSLTPWQTAEATHDGEVILNGAQGAPPAHVPRGPLQALSCSRILRCLLVKRKTSSRTQSCPCRAPLRSPGSSKHREQPYLLRDSHKYLHTN